MVEALLETFVEEIPGRVTPAIVKIEHAAGVASYDRSPDFDVTTVHEAYTDVAQSNETVLERVGTDPSDTTDLVVSPDGVEAIASELNADANASLARWTHVSRA